MHKLFRVIAILAFAQAGNAQEANILFQVKHLKSPDVVFGYYQGGKAYRLDSVKVDTSVGSFRIQKNGLHPGIYFCGTNNGKLFDFVISAPTDSFVIQADLAHLDEVRSPDSEQNEALFRFEQQRSLIESSFEAKKAMRDMVAQATKNDVEALKPFDEELQALRAKTDSLALGFIKNNPQHLYAKMLQAVRPPEPPMPLNPTLKTGKPNPEYMGWMQLHYWDNTDFNNDALLGNVFWQVYFDNFFARHVVAKPDSLILAIDEILAKTPRGGTFFQFIVLRVTQFYEQNDAPGADRIFVHMVDKHQKKDQTPWLDMATLERLAYKAGAHRPNLTGSLALNFSMPDETGKQIELYEIEAPLTMLVFYSPLCAHCMEFMPKIYQVYLDYQVKGLAAVAINTDNQGEYWKKFVGQQGWTWYDVDDHKAMEQLEKQYNAYNLPVIYLLDKDKRILAKRVKPGDLGAALGRYFR